MTRYSIRHKDDPGIYWEDMVDKGIVDALGNCLQLGVNCHDNLDPNCSHLTGH